MAHFLLSNHALLGAQYDFEPNPHEYDILGQNPGFPGKCTLWLFNIAMENGP
jgi:hypothetical protein